MGVMVKTRLGCFEISGNDLGGFCNYDLDFSFQNPDIPSVEFSS